MKRFTRIRSLKAISSMFGLLLAFQSGFCAGLADQPTITQPTMLVVPFCRGGVASYDAGVCRAAIEVLSAMGPQLQPPICAPRTSGISDQLKVITEYIDSHPELREKPFIDSVQEALHDRWPCK
jgi:hypothetical protein